MVYRHHGMQLCRFRQRRLARLLPGNRRAEPGHAGSQPHVQERGWQRDSPTSPALPAPGTFRKATASPAATGTATATLTSSSRSAGRVDGDKYHNILFQNPGQGNHWLTVKLTGRKTNRSAIGARIKVVPRAKARHGRFTDWSPREAVSGRTPSSRRSAWPGAERVATLEIYWPTSHTTQVFHGVAADQAIEITEFDTAYRRLDWKPLPQPR